MPKGIYAAASAMFTESRALDVVAQNLANASTVGYRRAEPLRQSFAEVMSQQGRSGPINQDGGAGVQNDGLFRVQTDGSKRDTGRDLDVALSGPGFLWCVI